MTKPRADLFLDALRNTPPSPCEVFECLERERCESQKLACTAFAYYVETGRALSPLFLIPLRRKTGAPMTMKDRPEPTGVIFRNMMLDEGPR